MNRILTYLALVLFIGFTSCNETKGEKLEERLEEKSDDLEDRSDDLEDAADYIEEAADDIEDALENFRDALEEVESEEDRNMIRKRIIEILDAHDQKFRNQ